MEQVARQTTRAKSFKIKLEESCKGPDVVWTGTIGQEMPGSVAHPGLTLNNCTCPTNHAALTNATSDVQRVSQIATIPGVEVPQE